jgi:rod shape determining protein RodA
MTFTGASGAARDSLPAKLGKLNWGLITLICAIAFIGVMMQYSVAESQPTSDAIVHGARFLALLGVAIGLAMFDLRFWLGAAYPLYALGLLLTLAVEIPGLGFMAGGAESWLKLGPVRFQPSEIMKIAIVLALARYYAGVDPKRAGHAVTLIAPLAMIAAPVAVVAQQPDLGTATLIAIAGVSVMFLAGLRWRFILPAALLVAVGAVAAYHFVLKDYQRDRIEVFLGLSEDPLGDGYNIAQSKIAVGAAGLTGAGYMRGPQSQGDFLPEKHTDFIFTMIVEEFGLLGGLFVLVLFGFLLWMCLDVATKARSLFGKLVAGGIAATTAAYVLINTAMVLGLFPVVGIPLPLVSYGGTSMLTTMFGMALVLSVNLHREQTGARGLLW